MGSYASISGTSMASPHVAGAAALLLQADPDLAPGAVRDVLQNNADPAVWSLNPGVGLLEGAFRQGAGLIDVDDAILATTSVSPGKIALGEGEAGPQEVTLSVTNSSDAAVTYAVSNNGETIATGPPSTNPGYFYNPATMTGPESVTVGAGETRTVTVTITPPDGVQQLYSGWVTFTPQEGDPLRVPYAGITGDYQSLEVLTPGTTGVELPVLGQLTECDRLVGHDCTWNATYDVFPDTGEGDEPVYTLVDGDVPVIIAHLEHQARSLTLTAYEADAAGSRGAEVGVVSTQDYLARTPATNGFDTFTWDGRFQGEQVRDGKYILEVTVLKALGDAANPAHTETFTSEPFTIASETGPPTAPVVDRYTGTDRYATAARISAETAPGVETVYVATGLDYPDALAGAARAGSEGAPVLLVKDSSIPAATQIELSRLQPQNIVVLGGPEVVRGSVASALRSFTDGTVTRLAGENRFETAAAISADLKPGVDTVYVATGNEFPDALAGAARAGALDGPVLLVRPGFVPSATMAELQRLDPGSIVLLGGTKAVSGSVATALGTVAPVDRVSGDTRYDTAVAISQDFAPGVDVAFVATGLDYPDALAGAARAGHLESPILLVKQDSIPSSTLAELQRLRAGQIVILGGFEAVSAEVERQIEELSYGG